MKIQNNTMIALNDSDVNNNTLMIPKTVTDLETDSESVFPYLSSVQNIIVETGNPELYVQDGCLINCKTKTLLLGTDYAVIPQCVEKIGAHAFHMRNINEVVIPESVKEIGYAAFASLNCADKYAQPLSIHISRNVQKIQARAFALDEEADFTVDERNSYFCIEGGCIVEKATNTLVASFGRHIVIPACVTRIAPFAFVCTHHESIVLHGNIEKIGHDAFRFTGVRSEDKFLPAVVSAPKNSYAYRYLTRNKINRKATA